jgi:heme exporter protein D
MLMYAKVFTLTVAFPSFALTVFFLTSYFAGATHPVAIFPAVSSEITFVGIVGFDTFVVGFGTYMFFKPKWWYIVLGSAAAVAGAAIYTAFQPTGGTGVFVASAIALAIACMIVLSVSIYILARIWKETLREKRRKRR